MVAPGGACNSVAACNKGGASPLFRPLLLAIWIERPRKTTARNNHAFGKWDPFIIG
jgi:hypothetical protein